MINIWILLTVIWCLLKHSSQQTLEEYKRIIDTGIQNALSYQLPTDATMYQPNGGEVQEFDGDFDFVIIGGGVTGSVLASRLSEREDFNILLIEAGNFTNNGFIQFPGLFLFALNSNYNWGYKSTPQKTACLGTENETCNIPRGRGVGGGSLINGLLYSRGNADNYNNWAQILNDQTWAYDNVLDYFKKSENFHWTNPKAPVDLQYHGTDGLLNVQHKMPNSVLDDIFFGANLELGINPVDYNGKEQIGASAFQVYTNNGRRQDLGSAFITPFLNRNNLKVITESYVTKLKINDQTRVVESVLFTNNGVMYQIRSKKEVILSAGCIGSPQILMNSGIGPREHLEEMGIPLIQDLQVGSTLKDQALVNSLLFSTTITPPSETIEKQIEDYMTGTGALSAIGTAQAFGFYQTENKFGSGIPNLEIFFDINQFSTVGKLVTGFKDEVTEDLWANNTLAVPIYVVHLDPKSTGTVRLKSNNPFEYPLINSNLLSDLNNEDIDELYEGLQFIFKLVETNAFQNISLQYMSNPLPACSDLEFKSKDYWYCFIRQVTTTAFHPVGTCPMGISSESGGVVDTNLQVFGVQGLRVADSSIFPTQIAGHPSVACILIGEKLSDVLKKLYHTEV